LGSINSKFGVIYTLRSIAKNYANEMVFQSLKLCGGDMELG